MADPLLLPGVTHPAVVTLRALLAEQMPEARYSVAMPEVYDAKLVELVLEYQKRKGLRLIDAKVGPETWGALRGLSVAPTSKEIVFTEDEVDPIVVRRDQASPTAATKPSMGLLLAGAAAVAWLLFS